MHEAESMECRVYIDSGRTPYVLHGVNVELLGWLDASLARENSVARLVFGKVPDYAPAKIVDAVAMALAGSHGKDIWAAETLIRDIWHSHKELGPYPCGSLLSEFQADRAFYDNYRDHVSHSLKCLALGMYLYEKCPEIARAFAMEFEEEGGGGLPAAREFALRWVGASLCHDVGYLVEAGDAWWETFADAMRHTLDSPLEGVFAVKIRPDEQAAIDESYGTRKTNLHTRGDLKRHDLGDGRLVSSWPAMEDYAARVRLCRATPPDGKSRLEWYYDFCETSPDVHEVKFHDHGVVSGLMLIKAWRKYEATVRLVKSKGMQDGAPSFIQRVVDGAVDLQPKRIHAIAAACALHNVNASRYVDKGKANPKDQYFIDWCRYVGEKFQIGQRSREGGFALGYLLRLVDALQCWGRPMFRALKGGEAIWEDKDISLVASASRGVQILLVTDYVPYVNNGTLADPTNVKSNSDFRRVLKEVDDAVTGNPVSFHWIPSAADAGRQQATQDWALSLSLVGPPPPAPPPVAGALPGAVAAGEPLLEDAPASPSEHYDDDIRARIESIMDAPAELPRLKCRGSGNNVCGVRAQSLHAMAVMGRLGADLSEARTVERLLRELGSVANRLDKVRTSGAGPEEVARIERLFYGFFTVADRLKIYIDRTVSGQRAGYDGPIGAEERLRRFLQNRVDDTATPVLLAEAIFRVLGQLVDVNGTYVLPPIDDNEYMVNLRNRLRGPLMVIKGCWEKAADGLKGVVDANSDEVHRTIKASLKAADRTYLGTYINKTLQKLPRNKNGTQGCWKGPQAGGTK